MNLIFDLQLFTDPNPASVTATVKGDISFGGKTIKIGDGTTNVWEVNGVTVTSASHTGSFLPGNSSVGLTGGVGYKIIDIQRISPMWNGSWNESVAASTSVQLGMANAADFGLTFGATQLSMTEGSGKYSNGSYATNASFKYEASVTFTGLAIYTDVSATSASFVISSSELNDLYLGSHAATVELAEGANTGMSIIAHGSTNAAAGGQTLKFTATGMSFNGTNIQLNTGGSLNLLATNGTAVLVKGSSLTNISVGQHDGKVGFNATGNASIYLDEGTDGADIILSDDDAVVLSGLNKVKNVTYFAEAEGAGLNFNDGNVNDSSVSFVLNADNVDWKIFNVTGSTVTGRMNETGGTLAFTSISDSNAVFDITGDNNTLNLGTVTSSTVDATLDGDENTLTLTSLSGSNATLNATGATSELTLGTVTSSGVDATLDGAGSNLNITSLLNESGVTVNVNANNIGLEIDTLNGSEANVLLDANVTGTAVTIVNVTGDSTLKFNDADQDSGAELGVGSVLKGTNVGIGTNNRVRFTANGSDVYNFKDDVFQLADVHVNGKDVKSSMSYAGDMDYAPISTTDVDLDTTDDTTFAGYTGLVRYYQDADNGELEITDYSNARATFTVSADNTTTELGDMDNSFAYISINAVADSANVTAGKLESSTVLGSIAAEGAEMTVGNLNGSQFMASAYGNADEAKMTVGDADNSTVSLGLGADSVSVIGGDVTDGSKLTINATGANGNADFGAINFSAVTVNAEGNNFTADFDSVAAHSEVNADIEGNNAELNFGDVDISDVTVNAEGNNFTAIFDSLDNSDVGAEFKGSNAKMVFGDVNNFSNITIAGNNANTTNASVTFDDVTLSNVNATFVGKNSELAFSSLSESDVTLGATADNLTFDLGEVTNSGVNIEGTGAGATVGFDSIGGLSDVYIDLSGKNANVDLGDVDNSAVDVTFAHENAKLNIGNVDTSAVDVTFEHENAKLNIGNVVSSNVGIILDKKATTKGVISGMTLNSVDADSNVMLYDDDDNDNDNVAHLTQGSKFGGTKVANNGDKLQLSANGNTTYNFGAQTYGAEVLIGTATVSSSVNSADVEYIADKANGALNLTKLTASNVTVTLEEAAADGGLTLTAGKITDDDSTISLAANDDESVAQLVKGSVLTNTKLTADDEKLALNANGNATYNFGEGTENAEVVVDTANVVVNSALNGVNAMDYTVEAKAKLNLTGLTDSHANVEFTEGAEGATLNVADMTDESTVDITGYDTSKLFLDENSKLKGNDINFTDDGILKIDVANTDAELNFGTGTSGVEVFLGTKNTDTETSLSGVENVTYNLAVEGAWLTVNDIKASNAVVNIGEDVTGAALTLNDDYVDSESTLLIVDGANDDTAELVGGSNLEGTKALRTEAGEELMLVAADNADLRFGGKTNGADVLLNGDIDVHTSLSNVEDITYTVAKASNLQFDGIEASTATVSLASGLKNNKLGFVDLDDESELIIKSATEDGDDRVAQLLGGSTATSANAVMDTSGENLKFTAKNLAVLNFGEKTEDTDVFVSDTATVVTSKLSGVKGDMNYVIEGKNAGLLLNLEGSDNVVVSLAGGSEDASVYIDADEYSKVDIIADNNSGDEDAHLMLSGKGVENLKLAKDKELLIHANNWLFGADGNELDIGDASVSLVSGSIVSGDFDSAFLFVGDHSGKDNVVVMNGTDLTKGAYLNLVTGDEEKPDEVLLLNNDYSYKVEDEKDYDLAEVDVFLGQTLDLGTTTNKKGVTLGHKYGDEADYFTKDTAAYYGVTTVKGSSAQANIIIGDLGDKAIEIRGNADGDSLYAGGSTQDNTISSAAGKRAYIGTSANSGRTHILMKDADGKDTKNFEFIKATGSNEDTADVIALMWDGGSYLNVVDNGNGTVNYQFGNNKDNYVSLDSLTAGEYTTWYNDNMDETANKKVKIDATTTGDSLTYADDIAFYLGNGTGKSKLTMNLGDTDKKVNYDGGGVLLGINEIDGSNGGTGNYLQAAADVQSTVRASNSGATTISGGQNNAKDSTADKLIGGEYGVTTFVVGAEMGNDEITGLKTGDTIKFLTGKYADIAGEGITVTDNTLAADFGASKITATAKTNMADVKDLTVEFEDVTVTWDGKNWTKA